MWSIGRGRGGPRGWLPALPDGAGILRWWPSCRRAGPSGRRSRRTKCPRRTGGPPPADRQSRGYGRECAARQCPDLPGSAGCLRRRFWYSTAARRILALWCDFRRNGVLSEGYLRRLKTRFSHFYEEFMADQHPIDEFYLTEIEKEKPSRRALARELWLQTEHLWKLFPDFVEALRQTRG